MKSLEVFELTLKEEDTLTSGDEESAASAVPFLESFENFYAREIGPVIGLAYILSGSRSGAEDLAQDAFLLAYKSWGRVGLYASPGGWVRQVVSNRAVSAFRRRAAEARALVRIGSSGIVVPEMSPDAEATWMAVRRLPKRQAQVVALRFYDGRTIAEIARILDCSQNTVKTLLQRAKHTLNAEFDEGSER